MVKPIVTVVIVNYNSGEMLKKCISKVLDSTIETQIFVSDNASTDNSINLLKEQFKDHPKIYIQHNQKNLGFSAANNMIYPMVNTDYILYLNPDCFVQNDTIEQLYNVMINNDDAGMIGCFVANMDGSEQLGCRGYTPTPRRVLNQLLKLDKFLPNNPKYSGYIIANKDLPKKPINVELISGSCMFVRKKAIEQVGLLDDAYFLYCEDYDWFYRFLEHGWKIMFTAETKVFHIKSHCTRQIPLKVLVYKAKGMWRYYDKFFKKKSNLLTTAMIRVGILSRLIVLSLIVVSRIKFFKTK